MPDRLVEHFQPVSEEKYNQAVMSAPDEAYPPEIAEQITNHEASMEQQQRADDTWLEETLKAHEERTGKIQEGGESRGHHY